MNPVLILTRNNLALTQRCIDSVRKQDIAVDIAVVDNGSTDGTREWLADEKIQTVLFKTNMGVSVGWNVGLELAFTNHNYALVVGNDTILAPWTYSALLAANVPFVSGVDIGMDALPARPDVLPLSPHPDFSCFLIHRLLWRTVGRFDESMRLYAGDCDYHIRAHRLGIPLWKASVPYNHERSSTMNRASAPDRMEIQHQANRDRARFKELYGCLPGTPEYERIFNG